MVVIWVTSLNNSNRKPERINLTVRNGTGLAVIFQHIRRKGKWWIWDIHSSKVLNSQRSFPNHGLWRCCDMAPGPPREVLGPQLLRQLSALRLPHLHLFQLQTYTWPKSTLFLWVAPTPWLSYVDEGGRSLNGLIVLTQLWTVLQGHFSSRAPHGVFSWCKSWADTPICFSFLLSCFLLLPLQVLLPRSLPKCSPHLRAASLRTQPVTCPKSLLKDLRCHENHLLCHAMCWNLSPEIVRRETLLTSLRKTHRIPNFRPLCFLLLKRRQNGVFVYCLIYPLSYVTKTAYL